MAQGAREAAIENYTRSVKLNPANAGCIRELNELGIAADDLTRRISVDLDAEVLAGYAGRYGSCCSAVQSC